MMRPQLLLQSPTLEQIAPPTRNSHPQMHQPRERPEGTGHSITHPQSCAKRLNPGSLIFNDNCWDSRLEGFQSLTVLLALPYPLLDPPTTDKSIIAGASPGVDTSAPAQ